MNGATNPTSVPGDRVRDNTEPAVQRRMDERIAKTIALYAHRSPESISRRLSRLDREWDIERVLETNASALALLGVVLGATRSRSWLLLSTAVLGFLMQNAIQGWCPPVPLFRRLGVRTQREIERERYALKILRGDFDRLTQEGPARTGPEETMGAVEK